MRVGAEPEGCSGPGLNRSVEHGRIRSAAVRFEEYVCVGALRESDMSLTQSFDGHA